MVDKDKIIEHLMGENQFYRFRIEEYEKQINYLKQEIQSMTVRTRMNRVKKEALKRDNYECTRCSRKDNLNVHHVVSLSEGGEDTLNNVETLCLDCHIKVHEGENSANYLRGMKSVS